jgi:hypothetical protein
MYVRIAMLYLEAEDEISAETFVGRSHAIIGKPDFSNLEVEHLAYILSKADASTTMLKTFSNFATTTSDVCMRAHTCVFLVKNNLLMWIGLNQDWKASTNANTNHASMHNPACSHLFSMSCFR